MLQTNKLEWLQNIKLQIYEVYYNKGKKIFNGVGIGKHIVILSAACQLLLPIFLYENKSDYYGFKNYIFIDF